MNVQLPKIIIGENVTNGEEILQSYGLKKVEGSEEGKQAWQLPENATCEPNRDSPADVEESYLIIRNRHRALIHVEFAVGGKTVMNQWVKLLPRITVVRLPESGSDQGDYAAMDGDVTIFRSWSEKFVFDWLFHNFPHFRCVDRYWDSVIPPYLALC